MDWRLSHPDWEGWGSGKKKLLHEIIPRFGLPRSLQSDNGTSFTSKVTQGVSKALGITYYLHCAWRPQFSGNVKRANQFLKSVIKKITQETSLGWKKALPIALLHTHTAPEEQVGLSPYEMLCGRPFVYVNDLFLDPEVQTLQSYTMAIGQCQQDIHLWGMNQGPKDSKDSPLYAPGTQVPIKVWKDGSPKAQLQPTWKGPYPVILSTPTAVKVPGHDSWIHYSWVKSWHETSHESTWHESSGRKQKRTLNTPVSPRGDLRYLFRTTIECHSNEHPPNLVSGDKISQDSSKEPTQLDRDRTPK